MHPNLKKKLLQALKSEEPVDNLINLIKSLKTKCWSQQHVYDLFEELLEYTIDNGTGEQADAIREVLDYIAGWCNSPMRLFDDIMEF